MKILSSRLRSRFFTRLRIQTNRAKLPLFVLLMVLTACQERLTEDSSDSQSSTRSTTASQSLRATEIFSKPVSGCGGQEMHFTARTHAHASSLAFTVHHFEESVQPAQAFKKIQASMPPSQILHGVVNAGFFNDETAEPYSFFAAAPAWQSQNQDKNLNINSRSTGFGALPAPKKAGTIFARPCLEWKGYGTRPSYFVPVSQDDFFSGPNGRKNNRLRAPNIFCAGPLLLQANSNNALEKSMGLGGFAPAARADGSDPLDANKKQARSASCIKSNGDFLIFAQFPDKCGLSLSQLSERLKTLGCTTALNHDGGTSVQYSFRGDDPNGHIFSTSGRDENLQFPPGHRPVPVWLAVSRKVSR